MLLVATTEGLHDLDDGSVSFEGQPVSAIALAGESLWAIVAEKEVWRRDAAGEWERQVVTFRRLNCLLPTNGAVLLGTDEAHLLLAKEGTPHQVDSFEVAPGRSDWFTPWGGPPDVRSLALSRSGTIFANVHVGGILRSSDIAYKWEPTIDIQTDVHEVIVGDEVGQVLAATAIGLALSFDDGQTWTFHDDGLHASYCRAVRLHGDLIFMSASVGPHGGRSALYVRPLNRDLPFVKCAEGLQEWFSDNIDTGCLDASGGTIVFATSDGRVFRSDDAGASWAEAASGLPPARHVVVAWPQPTQLHPDD